MQRLESRQTLKLGRRCFASAGAGLPRCYMREDAKGNGEKLRVQIVVGIIETSAGLSQFQSGVKESSLLFDTL